MASRKPRVCRMRAFVSKFLFLRCITQMEVGRRVAAITSPRASRLSSKPSSTRERRWCISRDSTKAGCEGSGAEAGVSVESVGDMGQAGGQVNEARGVDMGEVGIAEAAGQGVVDPLGAVVGEHGGDGGEELVVCLHDGLGGVDAWKGRKGRAKASWELARFMASRSLYSSWRSCHMPLPGGRPRRCCRHE